MRLILIYALFCFKQTHPEVVTGKSFYVLQIGVYMCSDKTTEQDDWKRSQGWNENHVQSVSKQM